MKHCILLVAALILTFSNIYAQEQVEKDNKKESKTNGTEKADAPAALNDKIEFKNGTPAAIVTITDEGNDAGSILLPSVGSPLAGNKLYNNGGNLFWGGSQLNGGSGASAINDLSDAKYDGTSLFLGEGAGINDDGTSNSNTAIGKNALYSNTTGYRNTSNGYQSLYSNTTGFENTANGEYALFSNTTGNINLANGSYALYNNTTGNGNVGIGNYSNMKNQGGSNNTIIGHSAGNATVLHNKSGSVFLGFSAGYNETTNNKLYIENSNSSSPLIWGDFANDEVKINGDFHVTGNITTDGAAPADNDWDINGNELLLFNPVDQYVGIGTLITETSAKLHVRGNNGVLFQGTHGSGTALNLGAGTRFHFYPKKSAIRGGNVNGTQWNDANIGDYSTAFGQNTIASGFIATALGSATIASGSYSAALGVGTKAEAFYSTAIGAFNIGGGAPTTIVATDPVFEVGIGTSDGTRANALTVLKNGKVGIGTSPSIYRFEINSGAAENPFRVMVNSSAKLTAFSNGGTSIGTSATAPANGLLVSGDINNTGGLLHASDLRFKTNIEEIPNTLEHIKKLRGVYYDWKRNEFPERNFNNKKQIGVIAQEVEKEFPELVNTGEDGYKSVDYTKLTPILIEAIKEQQKIIEELQKQNSEAIIHNSELENRLSKIESLLESNSFTKVSN